MDASPHNIDSVADQQPFTVLVTGANRQVFALSAEHGRKSNG